MPPWWVVPVLVAVIGAVGRARPSQTTSWSELSASRRAREQNIDNRPPAHVRPRLRKLARRVVDPLRAYLGHDQVVISSGYRSPPLNRITPGAHPNSAHLHGRAVDLTSPTLTPNALAAAARVLRLPVKTKVYATHLHVEML